MVGVIDQGLGLYLLSGYKNQIQVINLKPYLWLQD